MKKVVSQVAANNWGILFLMTDGTLKWVKHESPIWGYNDGISSRPDVSDVILPGVTQVAASTDTFFMLDQSGIVWGLGSTANGELGIANQFLMTDPWQIRNVSEVTLISPAARSATALLRNGKVVSWGASRTATQKFGGLIMHGTLSSTTQLQPHTLADMPGVVSLASGDDHSLGLTKNGEVWSWGFNGPIGLGRKGSGKPAMVKGLPRIAKIASCKGASYALTDQGQLYAWGEVSFPLSSGTKIVDAPKHVASLGEIKDFCPIAPNAFIVEGVDTSLNYYNFPEYIAGVMEGDMAVIGHLLLSSTGGLVTPEKVRSALRQIAKTDLTL